jgi:hypothetical protein
VSLKAVGRFLGGVIANLGFSGYVDNSGTPGNTTINAAHGRAAIAAAASACVVTNSLCTATSAVLIQRAATDTTAVQLGVVPGAGTFTVTANAAATAAVVFDFVVVN